MTNEEPKQQQEEPKQPPTMVQSAHEAAEALRVQNERMEKNIKELQELKSFDMLGGRSQGAPQETQGSKEEQMSDTEFANRALRGEFNKR